LVLDGGDGTLLSPVERSGQVWLVLWSVNVRHNGGSGSEVDSAELFVAEISELVHANSEGLVGLVVVVNEVQVVLEGSESVEELIVMIRLLVLLHPEGESRLVFGLGKS